MTNTGQFWMRCLVVAAVCMAPMFSSSVVSQPKGAKRPKYAEGELLVRFEPGTSKIQTQGAHAVAGARVAKSFTMVENLHHVKLPAHLNVKQAIELYRQNPFVLYAEPNYIVEAVSTFSNDPSFSSLWGLHNTGQSGGTTDADIDAPEAWDLSTGSKSVVVAVIDTGVDYNHQDLAANMFRNTADCNNNGVDDDVNGYIDDCYGINRVNNTSDPMDDNNHGTHVAGTIGALGNNSIGVVGVNWNVSIMACKFLNSGGSGSTSAAIECLEYVKIMKDRGVNIIATNNSWGGGVFSQALLDAIDAHKQGGILFIAAAGNDALDNDTEDFYPANYYVPNVISVAATTRTDALASFSDFGRRTVHLGAPGSAILSTTIGNTYSVFSGTSMATPHVAGVAALLKAQDPGRDWRAIKNLILAGGDTVSQPTISKKRLNAHGALTCSDSIILSRLRPISSTITASVGGPVDLAALHINCANPNGNVTVTVNPGGQTITLLDDGLESDKAAADGIYSSQWTPLLTGAYTLTFPNNDIVNASVLENYTFSSTAYSYRIIPGTNLNLSLDSSAPIISPFPIAFGNGSFTNLHVNSHGNVDFSNPFLEFSNVPLPTTQIFTLVSPFWDDLEPIPGTAQNVFWGVTGTAPSRELVVEWRDVARFGCSSTLSVKFQVVFFEGRSDILFNYADVIFGGNCAFADKGASATVGIQVSPTAATQFSLNSPSLSNNTALLWTIAPNSPKLSVSPLSADFGNVQVGSSADRTVTVSNSGVGTLTGNVWVDRPFSIVSGGSFSLGPGLSQNCTVRFAPPASGTYLSSLNVSSNVDTESVSLKGKGTQPIDPFLSVSVTSLDFGSQATGTSADQNFTVSNAGGGTLTGNITPTAPFSLVSASSFSVGAGQSQSVTVRFSPTATGTVLGSVTLGSNGGIASVTTSGTGASWFTPPAAWANHGGSFVLGQAQYADLNGDSKKDLIFQSNDNKFWVSLSTGTGFSTPTAWIQHGGSFVLGQGQYADLNGDRKADLIFQGNDNSFWVSLSTGTGFSSPALWLQHGGAFVPGQAQYADVDGDFRMDLIFQSNDNKFWVSRSTGTGFSNPTAWIQHGGSFVLGQGQYADLNGDRKADLIFQGNDNSFWVSLSTGTGFSAPALWLQHGGAFVPGQAQYADVDGDFRMDLIFQSNDNRFWVSRSTGTGFSNPTAWIQHGGSFILGQGQYADLNGDLKADLILQGNDNKFWASLSTGSGFSDPVIWLQHGGSFVKGQAQYADLNADGYPDLIFQGMDNWFWVSL